MRGSAMPTRSAGCVLVAAVALFCGPEANAAEPATKPYRIGWLGDGSAPSGSDVGEFRQRLRELRYVEGQNLVIEYRYANGSVERLSGLAAELARLPVDVIVTTGDSAALAAKRATKRIPIVATELALDPVEAGLVTSLRRPEGNVTGLATRSEDGWDKRMGLLKQVVTRLSRLAVLWNPANPGNVSCIEKMRAVAPQMGIQLQELRVSDVNALERAISGMNTERPDAIATCWDGVTVVNAKKIADGALKHRLPTLAAFREYVDAGALMSLGTSLPALRRRAADYVDRILKGAKPADLPVELPTNFDLVVNQVTANAIGVTLPATLLMLADDVVR